MGTTKVSVVESTKVGVMEIGPEHGSPVIHAGTRLNVVHGVNLDPVKVTTVPVGASGGVIEVITGLLFSLIQVLVAVTIAVLTFFKGRQDFRVILRGNPFIICKILVISLSRPRTRVVFPKWHTSLIESFTTEKVEDVAVVRQEAVAAREEVPKIPIDPIPPVAANADLTLLKFSPFNTIVLIPSKNTEQILGRFNNFLHTLLSLSRFLV